MRTLVGPTYPYPSGMWFENDIIGNIITQENLKGATTMNDTKIELMISGDNVPTVDKVIPFELSSKDEDVLYIKSTDGQKTLDLDNLDNPRIFMVYSLSEAILFTLEITISGVATTFECRDIFVMGVKDATWWATIDSIKISTTNTTSTKFAVASYSNI